MREIQMRKKQMNEQTQVSYRRTNRNQRSPSLIVAPVLAATLALQLASQTLSDGLAKNKDQA
jgi:hypothetical protein